MTAPPFDTGCPECGEQYVPLSEAPRLAYGPRRVEESVSYILLHKRNCPLASNCPLDTDGDGNCPVHRDCATFTRWRERTP